MPTMVCLETEYSVEYSVSLSNYTLLSHLVYAV